MFFCFFHLTFIFYTEIAGNPAVWVPCNQYYDSSKIDIDCTACTCDAGKFKFDLVLNTDRFPAETSWTLKDDSNKIILSNSGYSEILTIFEESACLVNGCYDFVILDIFGDGICCFEGDGYYKGTLHGNTLAFSGGEFGRQASHEFCGEDPCSVSNRGASIDNKFPLHTTDDENGGN